MKVGQGGSCLQPEERGSKRNQPANTLILDDSLQSCEKEFLLFKTSRLGYFVMEALEN